MKHLKKFENKKFKGYEVLDLKYDAPSYKQEPQEQLKFIKNNVDKLKNKAIIQKIYMEVMNALASDGQSMDEKIEGFVISAFNTDTKVDLVYCGHFDDKMLGYIHIELVPYGEISDIVWNKTFGKAVIFKNKEDAKKIIRELQQEKQYQHIKFKIKKITLNQGFVL